MSKIKINLFGEGIEVRHLQLDAARYDRWTEIAVKRNCLLGDLLLDPFFYHQLKDDKIKSVLDLEATVVSGILDKRFSQVEIWFDRHKVLKVKPHELFNPMLLFPLYKIENNQKFHSDKLESGLYILRKEIGLIASMELRNPSATLLISDFTFEKSVFNKNQFLSNIKYQNQEFKFIKSDALITYQTAFEVL